jgi:RNA polymerase subunit RPABC4/transcription elongation factor Spt4
MYISLFFIPLIKYKTGTPFLACDNCNVMIDDSGRGTNTGSRGSVNTSNTSNTSAASTSSKGKQQMCGHCGAFIEPDAGYSYCPYCGKGI